MSESDEERTQAPSKHRRQMARERGLVARSPELTAAVGVLAAVALLGGWGGSLAAALEGLMRGPLTADLGPLGVAEVAGRLRLAAAAVLVPMATVVVGVAAAMALAHGLQTGGLWAPGLIAPDLDRLARGLTGGGSLTDRMARGGWNLTRAVVLTAVAAFAIRQALPDLARLDRLEGPALLAGVATLLRRFALTLGLALLVLGALDYGLQWRRVEALLRQSPDQAREELKSLDGDPAVRARRQKLARSWLADPSQALKESAVILTGPDGLAVALGGSPPPGRLDVRLVARGSQAAGLVRAARRRGVPRLEAAELARWFAIAHAGRRGPDRAATLLPADLAAELARRWPAPPAATPTAAVGAAEPV